MYIHDGISVVTCILNLCDNLVTKFFIENILFLILLLHVHKCWQVFVAIISK